MSPSNFKEIYLTHSTFGSLKNGKNFSVGSGYRFGFSLQEGDNEISGTLSHLSFKYREFDSRIGKFWSSDILFAKFPWNSPFCYAENKVIEGIDFEGLEFTRRITYNVGTGQFNVKLNLQVKSKIDPALTQCESGIDQRYEEYKENY